MTNQHNAASHESLRPDLTPSPFELLPLKEWPAQRFPDAPVDLQLAALDGEQIERIGPQYRLGDPTLPVAPYRQHAVETFLGSNRRGVISSETGTGKSSQLGLYFLEAGAPRVLFSSPRIVAARELFLFAQKNLGPNYAHLAGYLTGDSSDSDCGPDARLINVTEQLLLKMANRGNLRPDDIVVFDEAHERSVAGVMLLGLIKEMQQDYPGLRLLASSATIDTERFARYLADDKTGEPAPVVSLTGRKFPLTYVDSEKTTADAMIEYIKEGYNVLGFEPGSQRLRKTQSLVRGKTTGGNVHILHGDQSPREQREALNPEDGNHVIATKIGETSITPVNKDVVVDGGLSNHGGYEAGKRTLTTAFSSKAAGTQRAGRVSRTHEGIYVRAQSEETPPAPAYEDRPDYDPPAIENASVAPYVLELLLSGKRLEQLDLLESPTAENLQYDMLLLRRLGGIVLGKDGQPVVTPIGRAMADLPLDSPWGRMVVAARETAETMDDPEEAALLRAQVAAAVAVRQVKGLLDTGDNSRRRFAHPKPYQDILSMEKTSDVLFELDVFVHFYNKQRSLVATDKESVDEQLDKLLRQYDVVPNRFIKAARLYEEICRREGLEEEDLAKPSVSQRERIIAAQIVGAEEIFVSAGQHRHRDIRGEYRTTGKQSTIATAAQLVVGTAFDLQLMQRSGRLSRRYIAGASVIGLDELMRHASERITGLNIGYSVGPEGTLQERRSLYFDTELHLQQEVVGELSPTRETREALIRAMMTGMVVPKNRYRQTMEFDPGVPNAQRAIAQWQLAQELEHRSPVKLNITQRYDSLIAKVVRTSLERLPLDVTDPAELDALIPRVFINSLVRPTRRRDVPEIYRNTPDGIAIQYGDEQKMWVDVGYRNSVAYVTVPREAWSTLRREDFAELAKRNAIRLRVDGGRYNDLEQAFNLIEKQRAKEAAKRRKQEQAQAKLAPIAIAAVREASDVERERRPRRDRSEKKIKKVEIGQVEPMPRRHPNRRRLTKGGSKDSSSRDTQA